ncbi:uncharacterized protein LOC129568642 isoform X2 [Sitodiplosis mosellana]|nr:uncharacterized protein LOC129568642 isoform X2 [Sitodiplosis mosellana]
MGLGALYLLHLLAQDYMKIRKPAAKLAKFLLSKRDLDAVERFEIDWDRILKHDAPFKCAQSLICQITAGTEKDNEDALIISHLLEYAMTGGGVPEEIELAHSRGKQSEKSFERCYKHYPYCPYSARTMLKVLQIYSYIFGG